MSNAEIIALIDAVLALPVSDSTKDDLHSFRFQVEGGTITDNDRNYIIELCKRLQRGRDESYKPSALSGPDDERAREDAEARRKRIECRHQAGHFFDSIDDMRWLYFDLAIKGAFEGARNTERELEEFVRCAIWAALSGYELHPLSTLIEEAAHYIDKPLFHCTGLRDFLIVRLTESLENGVVDPGTGRAWAMAFRKLFAVVMLVLAVGLYSFVNWWAAGIVLLILAAKAFGWVNELNNMGRCKFDNQRRRDAINKIVERLKLGGFDEPTIIRQLEALDINFPPPPKLVYIYGCPYFRGTEHTLGVPDVLYALLRLSRRNVESELSKTFYALNERKRNEITDQWRKFVHRLLTYDEPRSDRFAPSRAARAQARQAP